MKKLLCAALVSFGFSTAFAEENVLDLGPISEENAVQLEAEYEFDIMALLTEEQLAEGEILDIQRRGYTQRGRPNYRPRPPHHRPPVYRPMPPRPYNYATCYVRNERGRLFSATARTPRQAQSAALNRCHRASNFCFSQGCRY